MANPDPAKFRGPQKERSRLEPARVSDEVFLQVLDQTIELMSASGLPHAFMGGIASTVYGRERWTHDIDVFVRPGDAERALRLFAERGYDTEPTNPDWLFKAMKDGCLVDIIFRSSGPLELDPTMIERIHGHDFKGRRLPVLCAEDMIVIKALAHAEETSRHWFDALAMLRSGTSGPGLDWDYLKRRAEVHPLRVGSLLAYALGEEIPVPRELVASQLEEPLAGTAPGREGDSHLAAHVRQELAADPLVGDIDLEVSARDGRILVAGVVATPARRRAIEQALDRISGRDGWESRVLVAQYGTGTAPEELG